MLNLLVSRNVFWCPVSTDAPLPNVMQLPDGSRGLWKTLGSNGAYLGCRAGNKYLTDMKDQYDAIVRIMINLRLSVTSVPEGLCEVLMNVVSSTGERLMLPSVCRSYIREINLKPDEWKRDDNLTLLTYVLMSTCCITVQLYSQR